MADLASKHCVACKGGTLPLKGDQLIELLKQLGEGWFLEGEQRLEKGFKFKDFKEALDFTNQIGKIAEQEGHHPDIYLSWGKVKVTLYTHKIEGLSESDFIMAAKCDDAFVTKYSKQ